MSQAPPDDLRYETERELNRVVDRLNSMALPKAEATADAVYACATTLVAEARRMGVPIPPDAVLPTLGPQGFGAMISVLGHDCLEATRQDTALAPVHDALISLRRALP